MHTLVQYLHKICDKRLTYIEHKVHVRMFPSPFMSIFVPNGIVLNIQYAAKYISAGAGAGVPSMHQGMTNDNGVVV